MFLSTGPKKLVRAAMCPAIKYTLCAATLLLGLCAQASAQTTFEQRWELVPQAHAAEPPPAESTKPQPNNAEPPQSGTEAAPGSSVQENALQHSQPAVGGPKKAQQARPRVLTGKASFYAYRHSKTASGAPYDRNALTAASRTLPLGTRLRVTDPKTNKSVDVTVTDRGPASKRLILDLSLGAARALGMDTRGIVPVRAEIIS